MSDISVNINLKRGIRKTQVGKVISNKMNKTVIVQTTTRVPHPKFGKIINLIKKFYVHDESFNAQLGSLVRIAETRPISKLKRWRIIEIIKH